MCKWGRSVCLASTSSQQVATYTEKASFKTNFPISQVHEAFLRHGRPAALVPRDLLWGCSVARDFCRGQPTWRSAQAPFLGGVAAAASAIVRGPPAITPPIVRRGLFGSARQGH